jgi:endonuclease YncB( thermonuclease family)
VAFLLGLIAGSLVALAATRQLPQTGTVKDVYDGDTVTVRSGEETYKCRLLGLDAPELSFGRLWSEIDKVEKFLPPDGRREVKEAEGILRKWAGRVEGYGEEARDAARQLLQGKTVHLSYDSREPAHDQYGRLLVYVQVGAADASAVLINRGLAVADTRFSCDRLQEYVRLWRAAQHERKGIWSMIPKGEKPNAAVQEKANAPAIELWASTASDKYHLPNCRWAKRIEPGNLIKFHSVEEARQAGYKPCGVCHPPEE